MNAHPLRAAGALAALAFAAMTPVRGLSGPPLLAVGSEPGVVAPFTTQVHVYADADRSGTFESTVNSFLPFGASSSSGARVALGDVNGDGTPEVIAASGSSDPTTVKAFTVGPLTAVHNFQPYGPSDTAGAFVAAGDVNGDGKADIITGTGSGNPPNVRSFSGTDLSGLNNFLAYAAGFTGGVTVAAGDINGDGKADIVTAPSSLAPPEVKVFSGLNLASLKNFNAYGATFAGGVFVAAGDVNNDGMIDIITGPGPGMAPNVKVFSGVDLSLIWNFNAFDPAFQGGVRVAAGDINGDGHADLIVGQGPGGGTVRVLSGADLSQLDSLTPFGSDYTLGVYVAAIVPEPGTLLMLALGMAAVSRRLTSSRSAK